VLLARLRSARAVASDETGVRIEGVNAQHWVFRAPGAAPGTKSIYPHPT
jgi:transposase